MSDDIAPRRGRRKVPAKATPEALKKAALGYLSRYATPAGHLRRLLLARVARSVRAHGTDPAAGERAVEALIARLVERDLLDDAAYARAKADSLFRRGDSLYAIGGKLAAKGVGRDDVEAALAALRERAGEPDLAAALAYARRRRLGPFRAAARRPDFRDRDLAALGRRGFDTATARRVVDARDVTELEAAAGAGEEGA